MPDRRTFVRAALLAGAGMAAGGRVRAQEPAMRFLRIGTGNVNGTYFRIGGLIADIVSNPPGSRSCERGGNCGVPGLIVIAQSSNGSVDNVAAIQGGTLESGFAQSDVVHWAFNGTGIFAGQPPADRLRVLASLYPESVHLVVRSDAQIGSVRDLRGRRISLDAEGSGTIVDARLVLEAFGVAETELVPVYTPLGPSLDLMKAGELDAFFLVAGWPAPAVSELARDLGIRLVPIAGPEVDRLLAAHRFFSRTTIPTGAYPGVEATPTIAVGAQWIIGREIEAELAHSLLTALWHPSARERLDLGHPRGAGITPATALEGVSIPLHPGAERYYREHGLLP